METSSPTSTPTMRGGGLVQATSSRVRDRVGARGAILSLSICAPIRSSRGTQARGRPRRPSTSGEHDGEPTGRRRPSAARVISSTIVGIDGPDIGDDVGRTRIVDKASKLVAVRRAPATAVRTTAPARPTRRASATSRTPAAPIGAHPESDRPVHASHWMPPPSHGQGGGHPADRGATRTPADPLEPGVARTNSRVRSISSPPRNAAGDRRVRFMLRSAS